ncbi:MAG: MarR family transcriptional regulator [Desulfobacteraceae bacterium]|nr:MarR family transcriptional regulator [Desulfobacteraceae bacterium]
MTHKDDVLAFLQNHPGSSQRQIVESLNISPPQQVYNILKSLMENRLIHRKKNQGAFNYSMLAPGSRSQPSKPTIPTKTKAVVKIRPGVSREQQEAENWLIDRLSRHLSVRLAKKRLYTVGRSWLELDGYSKNPLIICEAWAHIGPPKSAQKNKVMADALKLLYVKDFLKENGRCILLFGDEQAASHFQHNSWNAKCLESQGIEVKVMKFTPEWHNMVLEAQSRQKR